MKSELPLRGGQDVARQPVHATAVYAAGTNATHRLCKEVAYS
jgi:hypothetical protein